MEYMFDPDKAQERIRLMDDLCELVGVDAFAHHLYDQYDGMGNAEKRKAFAIRIAAECSEMFDASDDKDHYDEQLADVIIMALSAAYYTDVEIGTAVERKRLTNMFRKAKHEGEQNHG